jgi:hypothetical protein
LPNQARQENRAGRETRGKRAPQVSLVHQEPRVPKDALVSRGTEDRQASRVTGASPVREDQREPRGFLGNLGLVASPALLERGAMQAKREVLGCVVPRELAEAAA